MAYKWFAENKDVSADDYVMFSNDDVVFDNSYIENALKILENREQTLLTGYGVSIQSGKQVDGAVNMVFPKVHNTLNFGDDVFGNCASTRSLFFRVKDFNIIGGFHPYLLPHYGSDYEWTTRAAKKGYKIYCTDKLKYGVNEDTTGIKQLKITKVFTKRSVSNPFYKITFAILAAPFGKKTLAVLSQIFRFVKRISDLK